MPYTTNRKYHPRELDPWRRQELLGMFERTSQRRQRVYDVRAAKKTEKEQISQLEKERQAALAREAQQYAQQQELAQQKFGFDRTLLGDRYKYDQRSAAEAAQVLADRDQAQFGHERAKLEDAAWYDSLSAAERAEVDRLSAGERAEVARQVAAERAEVDRQAAETGFGYDAESAARRFGYDRTMQDDRALSERAAQERGDQERRAAVEQADRERWAVGERAFGRDLEKMGVTYEYGQRTAAGAELLRREATAIGAAQREREMGLDQGFRLDSALKDRGWDVEDAKQEQQWREDTMDWQHTLQGFDAEREQTTAMRKELLDGSQGDFTPEGKAMARTQLGELAAIRSSRQGAPPKVTAEYERQWRNNSVQSGVMDMRIKTPTPDEDFQNAVMYRKDPDGQPILDANGQPQVLAIRDARGSWKMHEPKEKEKEQADPLEDFDKRYEATEDRLNTTRTTGSLVTMEEILQDMDDRNDAKEKYSALIAAKKQAVIRDRIQWDAWKKRNEALSTETVDIEKLHAIQERNRRAEQEEQVATSQERIRALYGGQVPPPSEWGPRRSRLEADEQVAPGAVDVGPAPGGAMPFSSPQSAEPSPMSLGVQQAEATLRELMTVYGSPSEIPEEHRQLYEAAKAAYVNYRKAR